MNEVIKGLPVIALKGMTILPYMVIHFDINRKNLIETVEYAMLHGQKIFITGYAGDEQQEDGREEQLRETGTVCEIKQIMKLPGSVLRVMVRGMERGKSLSYNFDGKIMFANVETSDAEGTDELLIFLRLHGLSVHGKCRHSGVSLPKLFVWTAYYFSFSLYHIRPKLQQKDT